MIPPVFGEEMVSDLRSVVCEAYDGSRGLVGPMIDEKCVLHERLPSELVHLVADFSSFREWVYFTGIFSPQGLRSAAEKSAEQYLCRIGVERNGEETARTQLLTHIFNTALEKGSLEQKIAVVFHGSLGVRWVEKGRLFISSASRGNFNCVNLAISMSAVLVTCATIVALMQLKVWVVAAGSWCAMHVLPSLAASAPAFLATASKVAASAILWAWGHPLYTLGLWAGYCTIRIIVLGDVPLSQLERMIMKPFLLPLEYYFTLFAVAVIGGVLSAAYLGITPAGFAERMENAIEERIGAASEKARDRWLKMDEEIYNQQRP